MSQIDTSPSELEIEHAVSQIVPKLQKMIDENYKKYAVESFVVGKSFLSELKPPTLQVKKGRKYYKLVTVNNNDFGGNSESVYGFIRKVDGAIFMAATWRRPQTETKSAIRGYITEEFATDYFTPHGVVYAH